MHPTTKWGGPDVLCAMCSILELLVFRTCDLHDETALHRALASGKLLEHVLLFAQE